jgi:hypothetical protein
MLMPFTVGRVRDTSGIMKGLERIKKLKQANIFKEPNESQYQE